MTRSKVGALWMAAYVALGAAGCGSETPPPQTPDEPVPTTAPEVKPVAPKPKREDVAKPSSGSIHVDDRIVKACGDLPTAHFAFDSSAITGDAAAALDAVARCFVSGPLKGRGLRLVGHTDPRGETEYNFALGHQRAHSVSSYLTSKGLEHARIATSSRGEIEATGTDDAGWARDRKVEIFLAE